MNFKRSGIMKMLFNSTKNGTAYKHGNKYITLYEAKKRGIVGNGTKRVKK